jgi:uncharacterized repeat protein (TIGR01451 family)
MRLSRFLFVIVSLCIALAGVGVTLALAHGYGAPASPAATCNVPLQYPTLQDALHDSTCDTIQVITGTYTANLVITRSVTIQGQAANLVRIQAAGTGPVISIASGTDVTLQGLTLSGGSTSAQNGGGIVNQGNLFIQDVLIENNTTQFSGGGIANLGILTLVNSTLRANQAGGTAGAIYLGKDSKSTLANVTISGNKAVNGGGAIADIAIGTATAAISNTTIVQNFSQTGAGGIDLFSAQVSVVNTILAQNNNSTGLSNYHGLQLLTSMGYNLEDGSDAGFTSTGDQQDASPLLSPLALNGGTTPSHALILGSPAIDAGNAIICSEEPVDNVDQRGVSRHQGASCDIGAYEYDATPFLKNGPARSPAGQVVTYTLVISAINPNVTGLKVEDTLPAGLVFNDQLKATLGSASYDNTLKKVVWNNASFSPAEGGSGATIPSSLYGYALAQCSDQPNQYYLLGGFDASGNTANQVFLYDAAQDVWKARANLPTALANASAACYQGRIYLLGGYNGSTVVDQMNIYDISTNAWRTVLHGLPSARMGAALGLWQGKLYLAGGVTSETPSPIITKTLNIYDIASDNWTKGSPVPQPVSFAGYAQSGGELFLAGGWSSLNPITTLSSSLRLNFVANNWSVGPSLPAKRAEFALLASDTSLYALGGVNASGILTNSVIQLDRSTWPAGVWSASLPNLSQGTRSFLATCTSVDGGRLWFPGGFTGSATNSNPYRPVYEGCSSQPTINVSITFQAKLNVATGHAITNAAQLTAGGATFRATTRTFVPPEVSVGDVSLPEGAAGETTLFEFPVSLSAADEQIDYITLSTQDGTATLADHDYRPRYQVLTIPPGSTLVTFTVTVNGDDRIESDEFFYVNILRSTDLVVQKPTGVGTILNDDYGAFMPILSR